MGGQLTPDELLDQTLSKSLSQAEEFATEPLGKWNTFIWDFFPAGQSTLRSAVESDTQEKATPLCGKCLNLTCERAASFINVVMKEQKGAEI